jgi:hypothetical protein
LESAFSEIYQISPSHTGSFPFLDAIFTTYTHLAEGRRIALIADFREVQVRQNSYLTAYGIIVKGMKIISVVFENVHFITN